MKISKSFKVYIHTLLITFICSYSYADQQIIKNFSVHESPIVIKNIKFKDFNLQDVDLNQNKGNIVVLNFWATWCAPCKKEMPSLDALYQNNNFKNLEIFAVNMEQPNKLNTKKFFSDLNIEKLEIFFDSNLNFLKQFKLRGVPTTILINKKGEEFARIIGEVNFQDKKFVKWLSKYD